MEEQRTVFQKTVLVILAAMIVVFGGVTAYCQTIEGVDFRGGFLRWTQEEGADIYRGKVDGEEVTITVRPGESANVTEVTYAIGSRYYDACTLETGIVWTPPETLNAAVLDITGVRVTRNGEVIFEGGYWENMGLLNSDGTWSSILVTGYSAVSGDEWSGYETRAASVVEFALAPELEDRGDWRLYAVMVFLTLLMMVDVAFPYTLFRWRYRWTVKDPEPTDDYMSLQHLGWVFFPILLLVGYLWAATTTVAVV